MLETKKGKTSVRTAHSLNPVPFIIYDPDNKYEIKDGHYGLANVAPTIVTMMASRPPTLAAEHDLSFIPNRRGILPRLFPTFVLRRYLSHAKEALNPYDSDPGAGAAVRLRQDAG